MKILTNNKIKALFRKILLSMLLFTLLSVVFMVLGLENAELYLLICALLAGMIILAVLWNYFVEQNKIMEDAVEQIIEYTSGNRTARIACDEEGELYRLFHEVNALAAILNAQAENEGKSKEFLKNTISDISHQLKTPLAALNIYNGLLLEETKQQPEINEFAALSEQELDRIETLVQNLLKVTKLDAGSIVFEKHLENVEDMMKDIELHFSYRAKQEEKKIILSGADDIFLVCDRDWMTEAIGNIVKNALDHTKSGDYVRIEWKQFASVIQIIVKDNGCGIHPEDRYHIFKRFYRSRFSQDTQGIGLGLPLAKSVIEAHDGIIEIDSDLGVGTSFILNFLIPTKL